MCAPSNERRSSKLLNLGEGARQTFWVRKCVIGNSVDFHDFVIRNGVDFQDFDKRYKVKVWFTFSENWYKVGYMFFENWYKVGYTFPKFGIRNGHVLEE